MKHFPPFNYEHDYVTESFLFDAMHFAYTEYGTGVKMLHVKMTVLNQVI